MILQLIGYATLKGPVKLIFIYAGSHPNRGFTQTVGIRDSL